MMPSIRIEDCKGAVEWLFIEEMRKDMGEQLEFLSPGAEKSPRRSMVAATPRRYIFGKISVLPHKVFPFR